MTASGAWSRIASTSCWYARGPVLVVWAAEDRLMPADHGARLAAVYPKGRLVTIDDSYTLVSEDQPAALTAAIRGFLAETSVSGPAVAS